MTPEIHASLRTSVCALIGELGTTLVHLDHAAEISRLPGEVADVQLPALASVLDEAANSAEGTALRARDLADNIDLLAHTAQQASHGITHEPDEAEGDR